MKLMLFVLSDVARDIKIVSFLLRNPEVISTQTVPPCSFSDSVFRLHSPESNRE